MSTDKPEELDVKSKASLFGERATFKKTVDPIERSGATSPRFREVVKQNDSKPSSNNSSSSNLSSSGKKESSSPSTTASSTTNKPSYPSSQPKPEPEVKKPDPVKTETKPVPKPVVTPTAPPKQPKERKEKKAEPQAVSQIGQDDKKIVATLEIPSFHGSNDKMVDRVRYFHKSQNQTSSTSGISENVKELFADEADSSDLLDQGGVRKTLKKWGIGPSEVNASVVVDEFTRGETNKYNQPCLTLKSFNDFVLFFTTSKAAFNQYQSGGSISNNKAMEFLSVFGYSFNAKSMALYLELFDDNQNNVLEFTEVVMLLLFLHKIETRYLDLSKSKKMSIETKDLMPLIRAMKCNCPIGLLHEVVPAEKFHIVSFESVVDLLSSIKAEYPNIQSKMVQKKEEKKEKKARVFKRMNKGRQEMLDQMKKDFLASDSTKAIISECQRSGKKWCDPDFPCSSAILPADRAKSVLNWLRPCEISDAPQLFLDGIDEGDVIQGMLGDCYLLSGLCVISGGENNEVENIFLNAYPEYGFYTCVFWIRGVWKIVQIDDRLPVTHSNQLLFARCRDVNEYWVPLVEKAYAKCYGSYAAIEKGLFGEAIVDMTGEPSEQIVMSDESDDLWFKLEKYCTKGFYMGCCYEDENTENHDVNEMGILPNHAYGLLRAIEIDGFRLLQVKNPWGKEEWNGPWSDDAPEWTESLKQRLNQTSGNDGTFWMEFCDWCEQFNRCTAIHTMDKNWEVKRNKGRWMKPNFAGGCINQPTWMKNPQYKLVCPRSCKVMIAISYEDRRLEEGLYVPSHSSGATVIIRKQNDGKRQEALVRKDIKAMSRFISTRDACCFFRAEANEEYTIIPSTFLPGIEGNFLLTVYTKGPMDLVQLTESQVTVSLKGELTRQNSGGCPNHTSWHLSPQYILKLKEKITATITIVQERKPESELGFLGYHLFAANKERKSVLDPQVAIRNCTYLNAVTVSDTFTMDAGVYNLVIASFKPGFLGKFGAVVQGGGASFEMIEDDWHKSMAQGFWKVPELCGGPPGNNPDWVKNPQVWFQLQSPAVVNFVLIINDENIRGIGFILNKSDTSKTIVQERFAKSDFKTEQEVTARFELEAGCYIVVPCTYKKEVEGRWELHYYGSVPIAQLHVL